MFPKLLLVEDDIDLGNVMKQYLEVSDFQVDLCRNGQEGLQCFKAAHQQYALCILDIMMPKMDGFSLAKAIKKVNHQVPFIFLTAKSQKKDRITGLQLGADDYICKPFEIDELVLRIQNILRRTHAQNAIQITGNQKIGRFNFNFTELTLQSPKKQQTLTLQEAKLLQLLWSNKNKIVKRADILTQLWGENDYFSGRSMDVFISRLRKYLKSDPNVVIENSRGVGFVLRVL